MTVPATDAVGTYGGVPVRNVWHMLLYVWGRSASWPPWRAEAETAPTLSALLGSILCDLLEQRLRIGLGREYVTRTSTLRGIRGRIDFARSIRERRFERGQATCTFTAFELNAPRNQIIRSVLHRLVLTGDFGQNDRGKLLRTRMRRLTRDLFEVDLIEVDAALIRRQQLGRTDADYALMLSVCEFIVTDLMPTDGAGTQLAPRSVHEKQALEKLFEAFVPAFYRHHQPDWQIRTQVPWSWPTVGPFVPHMKPDVVMRHVDHGVVILDTKFTPHALIAGQYGGKRFQTSHLYQLYAYVRTQEERGPEFRSATGVLLYPSTGAQLREVQLVQGHQLVIATVDLAQPWQGIEDELTELLEFMRPSGAEPPAPHALVS